MAERREVRLIESGSSGGDRDPVVHLGRWGGASEGLALLAEGVRSQKRGSRFPPLSGLVERSFPSGALIDRALALAPVLVAFGVSRKRD